VISNIRQSDPRTKKFYQVFPDADSTLTTKLDRARGMPSAEYYDRPQVFEMRGDLGGGYCLSEKWPVIVDRSGTAIEAQTEVSEYRVSTPDNRTLKLSPKEFAALLEAEGDLGALEAFGIDFALQAIEEPKVIEVVRKADPQIARFCEVFPECSTRIQTQEFRRNGGFSATGDLGNGYRLRIGRGIVVSVDGTSAEFREHSILFWHLCKNSEQVLLIDAEDKDAILNAKGNPTTVERIWSKRRNPIIVDEGDGVKSEREPQR
jgi:hypothetical protein